MGIMLKSSEFNDEYEDWLEGRRGAWQNAVFEMTVGELERGPLLTIEPGRSLREAIELMNDHRRGAVLVVREDELLGIFTERDVMARVILQGIDVDFATVGSLMTARPDTLPEDATLAQALRTMVLGGFRHLPVVDVRGRAVSMVSMRSIVEAVGEAFAQEVYNAPPESQHPARCCDGG